MQKKMFLAGLACVMMAISAQAASQPPRRPEFPGRTGLPADPQRPPIEAVGCRARPQPNVDWRGCDLKDADLRGADLSGANLSGANLTDARLKGTVLDNVRVSRMTIWKSGKNCTGTTVDTCPK